MSILTSAQEATVVLAYLPPDATGLGEIMVCSNGSFNYLPQSRHARNKGKAHIPIMTEADILTDGITALRKLPIGLAEKWDYKALAELRSRMQILTREASAYWVSDFNTKSIVRAVTVEITPAEAHSIAAPITNRLMTNYKARLVPLKNVSELGLSALEGQVFSRFLDVRIASQEAYLDTLKSFLKGK